MSKRSVVPLCEKCKENSVGPITFANPIGDLCSTCSHPDPDLPVDIPKGALGKATDEQISEEFYRRRLHLLGAGGS